MAITELRVSGYRSIRDMELPLGQINVLVGPNGCGKTNLYRSMYLIHAAAQGSLARTLLEEGGMPSALWAGKRGKGPVRMALGFTSGPLSYDLECGLPSPVPPTLFKLDPLVKSEVIRYREEGERPLDMLDRGNSSVTARDAEGRRVQYLMALSESESVLAQLREPHRFPQLSALRQEVLNWRFYHHFRTDAESPLRQSRVGIRTPVLNHDGLDLAAALATILEVGNGPALEEDIDRAFPGAELRIEAPESRFEVVLRMPGFHRPFTVQELSDGTLRYLCLLAALHSPRPPALMALNEPETSLHPDLMEPLGDLIVRASRECQMWVTTHSAALAKRIQDLSGVRPVSLEKRGGETMLA